MNLNNKKRNVIIFLILVIIIFTCFLSIKILTKIKNNMEIDNILTQNVSNTGWPENVPIIQSKFVNITKVSERSWAINIQEYVSYEDFKNYLIELYSEGFEPIDEMGSKNPKLLSSNPPDEENFVLLWCAEREDYNVEAYWQNNDYKNIDDQEYVPDAVTILLYSNVASSPEIKDDFSDVESTSGELPSGDNFEISGEITLVSGD